MTASLTQLLLSFPSSVQAARESLMKTGDWALVEDYLLVKLPLGGSDKLVIAKIVSEEELVIVNEPATLVRS